MGFNSAFKGLNCCVWCRHLDGVPP